jgi:hypothetical protein
MRTLPFHGIPRVIHLAMNLHGRSGCMGQRKGVMTSDGAIGIYAPVDRMQVVPSPLNYREPSEIMVRPYLRFRIQESKLYSTRTDKSHRFHPFVFYIRLSPGMPRLPSPRSDSCPRRGHTCVNQWPTKAAAPFTTSPRVPLPYPSLADSRAADPRVCSAARSSPGCPGHAIFQLLRPPAFANDRSPERGRPTKPLTGLNGRPGFWH